MGSYRSALGHGGVAAGMERENGPLSGQHRTNQAQPQNSLTENSSHVQVNDVVAQFQEQDNELQGVGGIIDFILIRFAMARNINNGAWDSAIKQEAPYRH